MKSTIRKTTYGAIYRLLNRVSPLPYDCGTLCGAICCSYDSVSSDSTKQITENLEETTDYEMGIYLLPGEEKLFSKDETWLKWSAESAEDYDFPESWRGKVHFIHCKTPPHCPREKRPLQCRFFPLAPYLTEENTLHLILSPQELPYRCPLIDKEMTLEPRFIKATYTVWQHLLRDPLIFDLVDMDSFDLRWSGKEIKIIK